jgi:GntR family transcriptional repressor for pyruvate dehydrogenase complex
MDNFIPTKNAKISNVIAEQIKSAILNGTFTPGDKLPSERELAERFQASRISIREAIGSLRGSGLLEVRHGSGVFVAEIDTKPMSDSLFSILRIQGTTINELTEARLILEPLISKLAAEKITPEQITRLEQNIAEAKKYVKSNPALASVKNIEFHAIISEATGNSVVTLTMQTLFSVVREMTLEIGSDITKRRIVSDRAIKSHEDILKAIKEKDGEKVYQLVLKHIGEIQTDFKTLKHNKPPS